MLGSADKLLLSNLLDAFLETTNMRGVALVCPSRLLNKAAELADTLSSIQRIVVNGTLSVFLVASDNKKRKQYIVVPGRFCSCPFHKADVEWTCKHDLAVRLRLAFGSVAMNSASINHLVSELALG